jgi:DNA polymerase/3'-5' exonuclease PolX
MDKAAIIQSLDAEIERLKQARHVLAGNDTVATVGNGRRRRRMSADARARIAAAQKARWARVRAQAKKKK